MNSYRTNAIIFYVGVPGLIGLLLGVNAAGIGFFMPWPVSVFFWITATLGAWWVFHLGTLAAQQLLKPWSPPLVAKLALGLALASVPVRVLINKYVGLFEGVLQDGRQVQTLPPMSLSWTFLIEYFKFWIGIYILWISVNFFFDRVVGMSRYRESPAPPRAGPMDAPGADTPEQATVSPASTGPVISLFLSRLPRAIGVDVRALQSEDHYLRVFTGRGEALILYRLSDAMNELKALGYDGLQVHRSYWVKRDAVVSHQFEGRKCSLKLDTGLSVPVSQTYREVVRREGLLG